MKTIFVIAAILATAVALEDVCHQSAKNYCSVTGQKSNLNCGAKYGGITDALADLQTYANKHIAASFDYLLFASHFDNYEKERDGFEKLFRKLSDEKWNDAINLMKHLAKRGGFMKFNVPPVTDNRITTYEISELESLATALDIEKDLADEALKIHKKHDAEIAHYIEEEFVEKQAQIVRDLSGYATDLGKILHLDDSSNSISLYLFDEYLQKNL